jgi:hypothetical protein
LGQSLLSFSASGPITPSVTPKATKNDALRRMTQRANRDRRTAKRKTANAAVSPKSYQVF